MNPNFVPGTTVKARGETFILLERTEKTYPTKKPDALVEWRVGFLDTRYGEHNTPFGRMSSVHCLRPISEIGTPNENYPEPIPGLNYFTIVEDETEASKIVNELAAQGIAVNEKTLTKATRQLNRMVKPAKKHRGRPAVAMNELKARNVIRDYKQSIRQIDDPLVTEAFDWMMENGMEAYLEKHFIQK